MCEIHSPRGSGKSKPNGKAGDFIRACQTKSMIGIWAKFQSVIEKGYDTLISNKRRFRLNPESIKHTVILLQTV